MNEEMSNSQVGEPEGYSDISDDISDYKDDEEVPSSDSSEGYKVEAEEPSTESSYHSSDDDFELVKAKNAKKHNLSASVKKSTRNCRRNVRFEYEGSDSSSENLGVSESEQAKVVDGESEFDERDVCYYTPATVATDVVEKVITHFFGSHKQLGVALYKLRLGKSALDQALKEEDDTAQFLELEGVNTVSQSLNTREPKTLHFLIKWKNKSYLHCTWETEESIKSKGVSNTKKLDNYKILHSEVLLCDNDSSFFEDRLILLDYVNKFQELDYVLCFSDESLENELISVFQATEKCAKSNILIERVSVLCKWVDLSVADSTWESVILLNELFPNAIEDFVKAKARSYYALDLRHISSIKFYKMSETPFFIQHSRCTVIGETCQDNDSCNILRDYQLEGVNWLTSSFCKKKSVILADEMGLGKTVQVISYLSILSKVYNVHGPYLIVVPLSTVDSWKNHFKIWCPSMKVVAYIGNAESREIMRHYEIYSLDSDGSILIGFNVVVTTYEMIMKDRDYLSKFDWVSLVVDEAHRLKNTESLLYTCLKGFYSFHRLLMTGTPIQNNLKELWSILHFIHPDRYVYWEEFEEQFSYVDPREGYFKLQREISPYILRRMKKDVEKSLPPKVEQILRVDMTKRQKEVYKNVLTKNYTQLSKELKCNISGYINTMMQLKKCCNHTSLIVPLDFRECSIEDLLRGSGKLILLDKLLARFFNDGSRVLIFSQMVMILDVLSAYLVKRRYSFQRLDGNVSESRRKQAMDQFNAPNSPNFCFLLSTKAGGLGINLVTADIVIIFDSDWNPQNDLQAQARAHRIGQKKTVKIYRLVSKNSVDENIVERARKKMILNHLVIQTMDTRSGAFFGNNSGITSKKDKKEISAILKFGADNLFRENDDNEDADLQAMDLDNILALAELRENESHSNVASAGEELLSSFNVANFKASDYDQDDTAEENLKSWSEIIPEDLILRIKEEEENEKIAQLYLPPRKRGVGTRTDPSYDERHSKSKVVKAKEESWSVESEDHSEYELSDTEIIDEDGKKSNLSMFSYKIKCLNKHELKKFINSYKRFPLAWDRATFVAKDAHLTDKPAKEITAFAKWLHGIIPKISKSVDTAKKKPLKISRLHRLHVNGLSVSGEDIKDGEVYLAPFSEFFRRYFASSKVTCYELSDMKECTDLIKDFPVKKFVWNGVGWEPKIHDFELLLGLYFIGLGNWAAMMDHGLLKNVRESKINSSIISKKLKARMNTLREFIENINRPDFKPSEDLIKKEAKPAPIKKPSRKRPVKKKSGSSIVSYFEPSSNPVARRQVESITLSQNMFDICKNLMKSKKDDFCLIEKLFKENGLEKLKSVPEFDKSLYKLGSHIEEVTKTYPIDELEKDKPFDSVDILTSALWSFVSKFTSASPEALYESYRGMMDTNG